MGSPPAVAPAEDRVKRAALALVACLVFAPAGFAQGPVEVSASLDRDRVLFGDPFEARVDVVVESEGDDVRVALEPGPFTPLEAPRIARSRRGDAVVISATQRLACLGAACLPGGQQRVVRLPSPVVRVNGQEIRVSRPASITVRSRVPASAIGARDPALRRTTAPLPPEYPVDPGTLQAFLLAGAAVLGVVAVALVVVGLRRAPRRRPVDPELRALRLLRESVSRSPEDRRRAADLLARVVGARGAEGLAERASTLAWSPPQPEPADADSLAGDAEQVVQVRR
jgi:hypothetical protein